MYSECGFPEPYNPTTSAQSLAQFGTATMSSPQGVKETVAYKLSVASGNVGGGYRHAALHLEGIHHGKGLSFFEDPEQKAIAQENHRGNKRAKISSDDEEELEVEADASEVEDNQEDKMTMEDAHTARSAALARLRLLEAIKRRERELVTAEQELDLQRAKMSNSIGGLNKKGVKFKIRERKR